MQVAGAQNISVENFNHQKHYFWQINSSLPLDKKNAIVLLKTPKKDFQFYTVKGTQIEAEEKDEGIILKLPDKTKFIVISHPDFGDYDWRVPVKYLKKHNYYSADLLSTDLTKEYKNPNQWVVFNISPENSILTIDSVMHRVKDGELSLYLPVGSHSYTIEAPFYEPKTDTILLTDKERLEKNIFLQPFYSYLTIDSKDPEIEIFIDDEFRGRKEVNVGRIEAGNHRISLLKNNEWIKDTVVSISPAEKKTIEIPANLQTLSLQVNTERFDRNPAPNIYREVSFLKQEPSVLIDKLKNRGDTAIYAQVHLIAEDSLSQIKIDREIMGTGEWRGFLNQGFHLITTTKDGKESISQYIEIKDNSPREIKLVVPDSSIGTINLHSNVAGASVIYDNEIIGVTPALIKELKAEETYTFTLHKDGYKEKTISVKPKGNDVIDLYVELKKH